MQTVGSNQYSKEQTLPSEAELDNAAHVRLN